jgi:septal ring factor EnvC (AmiA/AmiB activator)
MFISKAFIISGIFTINMKENPLEELVKIRRELGEAVLHLKEPILASQEEKIAELKQMSQLLQEKLMETEESSKKSQVLLRDELNSREAEILKISQKVKSKEARILKLESEVSRLNSLLVQSQSEKTFLEKQHEEQINDLKLKHDQEIYILKKIKNLKP